MLTVSGLRFFIFSVLVFGLLCSANDIIRLKARVKHLESRLNFQSSFRDEEYAEITERLDDIDKVLNDTVKRTQPVVSERTELSKLDFESVVSLRHDFAIIRTAFREEKTETERIRREIPKIESNIVSVSNDVDNYCKNALNNTDQILTRIDASIVSGERMFLDVKEQMETVTEDNKLAHQQDILVLQDIATKVQINTENIRNITEQIENFKTIITDMFSDLKSVSLLNGGSCVHLRKKGNTFSGSYKLNQGIDVYCDQVTDEGGWTVFQRRLNGEVDFYRDWTEYKKGFGDLDGEFWLGNDHLSSLTAEGDHELRVEMEDFDGNIAYAKYSKFMVYPEEDNYKLEVSGYSGTAGDSLKYHNGMMFTTFDRDNDRRSSMNCAEHHHDAWWYNSCYFSKLNGRYYSEPGKIDDSGIIWYNWKIKDYCLKNVEMKFR